MAVKVEDGELLEYYLVPYVEHDPPSLEGTSGAQLPRTAQTLL